MIDEKCVHSSYCIDVDKCPCNIYRPKTNSDRIRLMTDEELANAISDNIDCACCNQFLKDKIDCSGDGCPKAWIEWLKEEVKE